MNKGWRVAKLGEVLTHRKQFITIDDLTNYKRPRVQLHVQGIVLRDEVAGALIKTKAQQVCRAGELLVAEIDAKVGGFGIVPDSLDGSIVSSHYFLFVIDETKLDRRFLDFFIRTAAFRDQVAAQGSTNYAAIRPAHVLAYEIPLPPIAEQRRISARVAELAGRVGEARALREAVASECTALLQSAFREVVHGASRIQMRDLAPLVRRQVEVDPTRMYPELGIRSFGKGTFHKPALSGLELGSKRVYWIEPGDLLFSNVFAWEGAIAVASPQDSGRVGSHRFITRSVHPGLATASFLLFYFLTPEGMEQIQAASPGAAGRNRTLGLTALDVIEVPVPDLAAQHWFDSLQKEVAAVRQLQIEGTSELNALLPSVLSRTFEERV